MMARTEGSGEKRTGLNRKFIKLTLLPFIPLLKKHKFIKLTFLPFISLLKKHNYVFQAQ